MAKGVAWLHSLLVVFSLRAGVECDPGASPANKLILELRMFTTYQYRQASIAWLVNMEWTLVKA